MQSIQNDEDALLILPRLDLFFRSMEELGEDWKDFSFKLESYSEDYPDLGLTAEQIQSFYDMGVVFEEIAAFGDELVETLEGEYSTLDYITVEEREIPTSSETFTSELISPQMAAFFDTFDSNGDGEIDIGEGQDFFYWVENNVQYRYDDEYELEPIVGFLVGDGREGHDYRQTPSETLEELFADCEDMATLEQAFYNYFGVEAYVVGVNADSANVLDHAATVVRIAEDVETFETFLGGLVYYDFEEGTTDFYGNPVTPGVYMLIDNAYSDAYGYLSNGLEPNTFTVQCLVPLDYGYDAEWNSITYYCGIPMD